MTYELFADGNHWVIEIKQPYVNETYVKFASHDDAMSFLLKLVKEA